MSTTNELVTITEYGPPYWDDRAWNPDRIEQRERRLFRALHTGDADKVLKQVNSLRERYDDMDEEHGKSRAFVIDFVLKPEQWAVHLPILAAMAEPYGKTRAFAIDMP